MPRDPLPDWAREIACRAAEFPFANLCRIGNRPDPGEKIGKKTAATIWRNGGNRGKAQSSSTRTDGGMHDHSDVDPPPASSLAVPGLTGSAPFHSVDRMTRAPVSRRAQLDSGHPLRFRVFRR
ncbi:hypothetical protein USDA257_c40980 [Sinorhizobium fredii USDA 257]|uniref:Uncharacterized protein n=1 Tax=Sinorhizobium fredii (strain USDA 257) TaxID=1185652 RepID=I3X9T4_SINF2|nr:hypothetical protein USDA257_c40980 [Sinorhizobium fredii USDA 257]